MVHDWLGLLAAARRREEGPCLVYAEMHHEVHGVAAHLLPSLPGASGLRSSSPASVLERRLARRVSEVLVAYVRQEDAQASQSQSEACCLRPKARRLRPVLERALVALSGVGNTRERM